MPKIIYDILPPKYHQRAKYFWQENSGKIKLGGVLVLTLSALAFGTFLFTYTFTNQTPNVLADSVNLRPDGDQTAQWPTLGTDDASCAGGTHCDQVDDNVTQPTGGNVTNYVGTGTAGAGGEIEEYNMTTTTGVGEVTSIKFWMYSQTITLGSTADTLSLTINIGGADQTPVDITPSSGVSTWQSATFNGSWTQADLNGLRLKFTRNMLGTGPGSGRDDDIAVATTYAEVTYAPPPTYPKLNQTGYIWENDDEDQATGDAVDENTQQFAGNTAKTSAKVGERVTLRTQIKNTGADALESTKNLGLFYDRNDGYFTKVEDKPAVTSAGNCTDTKWDCTGIYTVTSYASAYDVGLRIAFDLAGNPWMAFYNNPLGKDLLVAKYVGSGGTGCLVSSWTCYNIDTANDIGSYSSIAFSPSGSAWVSYYNATSPQSLKVANYVGSGGTGCATTEWTCTTVDAPANSVGNYTSIAFDSLGKAWVSYTDNTAAALKVAKYVGSGGTGCTSTAWTCSVVDDPASGRGAFSSIAFDSSGNAWISHRDITNTALLVSQYVGSGGTGCTSTEWTCTTIEDNTDSFGNYYTAIAFDPSGNPWLSYFNETVPANSLKVAQYVGSGGTGCASTTLWTCTIVEDTANSVGWYSSIAFSPSGNAWVSYADLTARTLKLARYVGSSGSGCTSTAWTCSTIDDPANNVGEYTSIAFDPAGTAWVSYYDATANTIKIANLKRGGEIGISAGLAGANGDAHIESHADMTTTSDTVNRDDADCIGGGTWNNGKWFESEEATGVALPAGSGTAQCTEISWNLDLSQAQQNTTYRFVVASNDSFRKDKGYWRGMSSISQYATLTTEASTTKIYSKDNQAKFANCSNASWGCVTVDDPANSVGAFSSIAIDPAGNPWIAYQDTTGVSFKVARFVGSGGTGCGGSPAAWTCENINALSNVPQEFLIAFSPLGVPWVSYFEATSTNLRVAKYVGSGGTGCSASSAWTCETVDDPSNTVGGGHGMTFDLAGNLWITYQDSTAWAIKLAKYVGTGGTGCTNSSNPGSWSCEIIVDDATFFYEISDIAIHSSGKINIAYRDSSAASLNLAKYVGSGGSGCGSAGSSAWSCEVIHDFISAPSEISIEYKSNGDLWVAYKDTNTLYGARYVGSGGSGCAGATNSALWFCELIHDGTYGDNAQIQFDHNDNAWIIHKKVTGESLEAARYVGSGGTGCSASTAWICEQIHDVANNIGATSAFAIDQTGVPWISHQNFTNQTLEVTKAHLPSLGTNSHYVFDTKGYSDSASDDAAMDSIIAGINERPYQSFVSINSNATTTPAATWIGQSTIAAGTQNIKLEIYRFGSTNAWETTATNSTCSANVDCTITNGALAGPAGEYYENSGSCGTTCKVYWRGWQEASASTSTTLKVDSFNGTFGGGTNSVAGTVCTNEACSTNVGAGVTIVLKKNGADACSGACTATTAAGGTYSITGITSEAQNDVLTIYIGGTAATDDNGTYNAVTITKINAAGDLTGINLITSRIVVRHETGISSLVNTDLQGWDKDNDADIKFTSNVGAFVSDNTEEVHIWTGKSWIPGGTVTISSTATQAGTPGDLHIDTSSTLNMAANALSVGGDFTNAGTFSKSAGQTTTFTATATGFTIDNGTGNLDNVIFNGASGGWSFSDASNTIDGDLTVTVGTLSGTTNLTVSGGDITGAGDINLTGGTFTLAGTGTIGSNTAWDFNDVAFNGTTTRTAATTGAIVVAGSVTGSGSIDLSATTNTFEQRVSANKNFGSSSGASDWTFVNLTFSNSHASAAIVISPPVNASAGSIKVTGTLQIGKATDAVGANTTLDNETANDRIIDVDGSIDIQAKGILQASSTKAFYVAGNWTRNGTFTPGTGTVTFNCTASCATALIAQSTTFYSVSFLNASGITKNVKFGDATTLATSSGGVLTITGTDGTNRVELDSNTGGATTWNVTHHASATESVTWAGVKNSACASSSNIDTASSIDRTGNGTCWIFVSSNTVAISALGAQNNLTIPSTGQYFGGTFVIARNNGTSTSLTNVTVSDTGTADTRFALTNVKLFFDIDITSPYDCASESYPDAGSETQFGSTLTSFDGSQRATFTDPGVTISGTQTFCGYLVADVVDKGIFDIKFDLRTGKRSSGAESIVLESANNSSQKRTITISSEGGITVSE